MSAVLNSPAHYFESGTAARQVNLSITRLHELGAELGLPAARTDGGRRLWTAEEIRAIQRLREERQATRVAGRDPQVTRDTVDSGKTGRVAGDAAKVVA